MDELADIFGPDGLLADAHPRYEHRPRQIEMAEAVERSFEQRRASIIEAATGTGKTLAYLIPALRSGKRVVISTGTKALQEQLFHRDIPFLERHWPEDFEAALLKGRSNYLCKLRFQEFYEGPKSVPNRQRDQWKKIVRWAERTETGDRAEIEGLPDDSRLWQELSVGADNCLHTDCPVHDECFVTRGREAAQEADILVVNHHLFFADLSLKDEGVGEILPEYDAVVFDEAHHLEGVATSFFGTHVSNYRFDDLGEDIERTLVDEDATAPELQESLAELETATANFFDAAGFGFGGGRYPMDELLDDNGDEIDEQRRELKETLAEVRTGLENVTDELGDIATRYRERCMELGRDLDLVVSADDDRYAYFAEIRGKGTFLKAAPVDLAKLFRQKLLGNLDAMVFTSATLATGGDLEFFKQRMGMSQILDDGQVVEDSYDVDEMVLPSVFDYEDQAAIYVPHKMPPPSDDDFTKHAATVVEYLLDVTDGRAFVLFTSYSNLDDVYDRLADDLAYTTLRQGDRPKRELLETFRADTSSVLFATSSFWEGVDVEGDALSMVIIDKLPFANPSDPLVKARLDLLESRGRNPFREFSLPKAALSLKQGFGRLIRSRSDQGIVAILDSRIANRRYGRYFMNSLPPAPVRWTAPATKHWWQEERLNSE
jgi:ATP-dependent DNA helicase DinG